ncbi:MAG: hypothetical protein KatS3mg035_1655 [Bacteroidia bacterium]|nr:MAG: hypothetical protein KatS3mg035_1655 [Bacteroidia bacterium]
MILPVPLQVGQVLTTICWKKPPPILFLISPVPLQVEQVFIPSELVAPFPWHASHSTSFLYFTFFSQPVAISSKVSFTVIFISGPFCPLFLFPLLAPPPKKLSNPDPKISENCEKISLKSVAHPLESHSCPHARIGHT